MKFSMPSSRRQLGATAVEFALVSVIFFMLLIGTIEFARILFLWNTATEATRLGARIATVCDKNSNAVGLHINRLLPSVDPAAVVIDYLPTSTCGGAAPSPACVAVTVSLPNVPFQTVIPFVPFTFNLPPFSTTLTVESLTSVWPDLSSGTANPVCQPPA